MPRDSNGVYSLPAGNPVAAGTLVEADWANITMEDIEDALNDILTTDGAVSGPIEFPDGSETNPSITFVNETTTGIYYNSEGDVRVTVLGDDILRITDEGVWIYNETTEQWEQILSGSDLDSEEAINQSTSVPEKFRKYFLQWVGEAIVGDTTTVSLEQIKMYKRGGGFVNGTRWSRGDLITLTATQLDALRQNGGSTPIGDLDTLFDGTNNSAWSGTGTTNTQETLTLLVDFGEGNEERLTGLEFHTGSACDPLYAVAVYATNEEDITLSDFIANTYTGTVYLLGSWSTNEAGNAAVATIGTDADSPHFALGNDDALVLVFEDGTPTGFKDVTALIPDQVLPLGHVDAGGDALWEFDTTVKTSAFTAEAGKYYFVDSTSSAIAITMPSSPSAGDVVLFRQVAGSNTVYMSTSDDVEADGTVGAYFASLPTDSSSRPTEEQPYAGVVYINATYGWVVFVGALEKEVV